MPPESTKFSEFQKQITASLEENGIDLEKTSVADILQRLQLVDKVDRETMRQVLRADNYQGTERIRRLLQAAIDGLNGVSGWRTHQKASCTAIEGWSRLLYARRRAPAAQHRHLHEHAAHSAPQAHDSLCRRSAKGGWR